MTPFYALLILWALDKGAALFLVHRGQLTVSRRPRKPKEPTS